MVLDCLRVAVDVFEVVVGGLGRSMFQYLRMLYKFKYSNVLRNVFIKSFFSYRGANPLNSHPEDIQLFQIIIQNQN